MNISESPAVLTIDTTIAWYSQIAQTKCHYRLRIYKIAFDQVVVIVSELQDNSSRLITREASTLIDLVCYNFGLAPEKTMWVEHYPAGYLKEEETYKQVLLVQGQVHSTRISKQKLEALLGVKL